MRYLGFDYGQKRIGFAGSDSGSLAQPLGIITVENSLDRFNKVCQIIKQYQPESIIFGLPINNDQSNGPMVDIIRSFINQLEEQFKGIEIRTINEHLTSIEAKKRSKRKAGESIDDIAASVILEQYFGQEARN